MCLILFLVFLCVALSYAWFFYREMNPSPSQEEMQLQEQQRRDTARCLYIEEGLREWLKMLNLPQLEEGTKLQEASRQLRIVLVERLMQGPRVR